MIVCVFPSPPLETNAFLIAPETGGSAIVIDPALESTAKILREAKARKLVIEKILLTHSHWDHFADAKCLQEQTHALLYVHQKDAANVKSPGADGLPILFPIPSARVDRFLEEGETISVGSLELEVIHTPGHSPGSVCFYIRSEKTLFSGDTLFHGSYGRLDLPTGEPQKMGSSLKKLLQLPAETRVFPGHGERTTIGAESWMASFTQRSKL